jgi:hypothetical protein
MTTYTELKTTLDSLGLKDAPVIAHASLRSFGEVEGGAPMVVQAFVDSFGGVVMPTHTYKTMLVPQAGPDNNAMDYGKPDPFNPEPEFFTPHMPADVLMGAIPEALRQRAGAKRSSHPILSFAGFNADAMLATQTIKEPLAPIQALAEENGWVVLACGSHGQHQHAPCRKACRPPAIHPLGAGEGHADPSSAAQAGRSQLRLYLGQRACGGMSGFPGMLGRVSGHRKGYPTLHQAGHGRQFGRPGCSAGCTFPCSHQQN